MIHLSFETKAAFFDELNKVAASRAQMAAPQQRSGRRSMRVDTMLKKDKEGKLFKKSAGLMDVLKAPIPGTKDWFINTGKQGLQGASKITKAPAALRSAGTRTGGGVTSIDANELKRLGFGDLAKTGSSLPKPGDVPSMDGDDVGSGTGHKREDGRDFRQTLPVMGGVTVSSESGPGPRM